MREAIARNKRNSIFLGFLMTLVLLAIGFFVGLLWSGGFIEAGILGAVIAFVVAFFMLLISYYSGGGAIMAISRAKEIQKRDDPQLFNVVEELSIAAGTPVPRIYVIDDPAPNAFATGRNPKNAMVAITAGLRQKLTRDELQGVMAHELSHVTNYDILFTMLMAVLVGSIVMISYAFTRSLWFGGLGGRGRSRGKGSGGGRLAVILMIVGLIFAIIAPILAQLIQLAVSRQREYLADASAAKLTRYPQGLADALAKISGDPHSLKVANGATAHLFIANPVKRFARRGKSMWSTHPPIEDRIGRLMEM